MRIKKTVTINSVNWFLSIKIKMIKSVKIGKVLFQKILSKNRHKAFIIKTSSNYSLIDNYYAQKSILTSDFDKN